MTTRTLKDLKEGLSSSRKPDITHVRLPFMIYTARACELGDVKYERSNFLRRVSDGPEPTAEDFKRFRAYLRACASHLFHTLDAMERHQAQDPNLEDIEGMKRAAFAPDTDVSPGGKVGASGLPHVSPACSSLMMAITQAVDCGLLPADPGRPWEAEAKGETGECHDFMCRLGPKHNGAHMNRHGDVWWTKKETP